MRRTRGNEKPPTKSFHNREATCNSILDATSQLIAETGVDGFTISDVAERGNVNRSLIYYYYRDRTNLISETIRFIVRKSDELRVSSGDGAIEGSIRLYAGHPEIGRLFLHLMLAGRPIPNLTRVMNASKNLERLTAVNSTMVKLDPLLETITCWLLQLAWSNGRQEIARLLGLSVEEADRRFLANARMLSRLISQRS